MSRILFFVAVLSGVLVACDDSKSEKGKNPEKEEKVLQVSSISVESSRGNSQFDFKYPSENTMEVGVVAGSFRTNMRYEFNESDQLIEWMSGNNLMKYQYGPNSNRISSYDSRGAIINWEYDAQNRVVRETERLGQGKQRISTYTYGDGDLPVSVSTTSNDIIKTFVLTYFDQENPFADTCEMVYSYDLLHWLGYGALYGDQILKKAQLIIDFDSQIYNQDRPKSAIDLFNESPEFELEKSERTLKISKKSENSIHWSATVRYAEFDK